ncbi:MAG TPA: DMT family transporter [Gaiellaceae bacterium]|nr:DMT family transporter [Gaiellaceae bacterium]
MSGGNAIAAVLSASAGLAAAVQVAIFGRFGDKVGTLPAFAFSCVITAVIATGILVIGQRTVGGFATAWQAPKWLWIGGVLGAFIVLSITIAAPRIGTFATVALIIAGQLTISTIIDRFGLFGLQQVPFTPYRVAGIILLAVGALLALKR